MSAPPSLREPRAQPSVQPSVAQDGVRQPEDRELQQGGGAGEEQQEYPDVVCRDRALLQSTHTAESHLACPGLLLGPLLCPSDDSK